MCDLVHARLETSTLRAIARAASRGGQEALNALRASAGGRAAWLLMQRAATVFLCATFAGCVASTSSHSLAGPTTYEFRLVSETLKDEWARDPMFWIDNERVVFAAERFENGKRSNVEGIYLWNDRTQRLEQIAERGGGFCHSEGWVSYFVRRDGRVYYREGEFGKEQETDLGEPQVGRRFPRVRCRAVPVGTVPDKFVPLIGGGFLEDRRGAPDRALPYRYYKQLDAAPVELPMNPVYTGPDLHRYSEYTRSHIFLSSVFDRTTRSTAVWQVFADGRTQTLALEEGPWSDGPRMPLPTTKGWLVAAALNGVYLMQGGQFERISAGQVRDTAVSPDGCRAALKMRLGGGSSAIPMPVYVVNLCNGGRAR
jgi:hypothetical protein